ncbi:MAG: hypothetical protein A3A80_01670 [Candidatus Terrybacteria bacterium RIFCSPLOWO2_01_FULL_44_24]|uniref:Uncharacterized protein n=1 Tax=Candidatus Terrybacteria bacterium RIFCSPHIGHO2_01_FULL_43_35 TaxID=1802361 RepID=A0A1G2PH90_9BACT|nr:MAG: hypothetical protein A2828_04050 [Candidatus Terrybacteria bacterium RIFCSPHIGHO2_01_FULL_43_35]OHA49896.1 MAG: hypothetical protein A3B75_03255 [Candidatus Terrybacteria bacterium RIFCSPHIGHO2_02_FULL_43_14]OHA51783.1 MAG: hypothetical protein A3A80_01670 [Candidatus Terrybacteria bacterium RIFCSPLOWO2_01_FULL_44_24]
MKVSVKVKAKARENKVEKLSQEEFLISTKESPIGGRANRAVVRLLAEYLGIPPSALKIVSGLHAKHKLIEII